MRDLPAPSDALGADYSEDDGAGEFEARCKESTSKAICFGECQEGDLRPATHLQRQSQLTFTPHSRRGIDQ